MRNNVVGVLGKLASISLVIGFVVAGRLAVGAYGKVVDMDSEGWNAVFAGIQLAQSLFVGFLSVMLWALLRAVSEGLRMLYTIAENTGAAPGQEQVQPAREPPDDLGS